MQWAKHQRALLCHRWHSLFFCWRLSNRVAPFWIGGELPVFVVRPHAPNRDACTLMVWYGYMYRATPNIYVCVCVSYNFATFFINKINTISAQFSTPQSVKQTYTHSHPSLHSLRQNSPNTHHPTTCPLDPIPSHLLQAISPVVVPALTHIINTSLHTGVFPSAFRQAHITLLLKKPTLNPSLLENYRPVSLLPFIAKTLERAVFNQVSAFLSQNNLLDSNQSGFRSGHSTETALLSVVEALRLSREDSKSSILILLDLSTAFDTVNH